MSFKTTLAGAVVAVVASGTLLAPAASASVVPVAPATTASAAAASTAAVPATKAPTSVAVDAKGKRCVKYIWYTRHNNHWHKHTKVVCKHKHHKKHHWNNWNDNDRRDGNRRGGRDDD